MSKNHLRITLFSAMEKTAHSGIALDLRNGKIVHYSSFDERAEPETVNGVEVTIPKSRFIVFRMKGKEHAPIAFRGLVNDPVFQQLCTEHRLLVRDEYRKLYPEAFAEYVAATSGENERCGHMVGDGINLPRISQMDHLPSGCGKAKPQVPRP